MVLIASHCIGVKIEVLLLMGDLYAVCYLLHPIVIVLGVVKMSKIEVVRIGFSHCLCVFFLSLGVLLTVAHLYLPTIFLVPSFFLVFFFRLQRSTHAQTKENIHQVDFFKLESITHSEPHSETREKKKTVFFPILSVCRVRKQSRVEKNNAHLLFVRSCQEINL